MVQVIEVDRGDSERPQAMAAGRPLEDPLQRGFGIHEVHRCAAQDYLVAVLHVHAAPQPFFAGSSCPSISS